MVWQGEQAHVCGSCGQDTRESMDRARQFGYEAKPVRCHACRAVDDAAKEFAKKGGVMSGIRWRIEPT